MQIDLVYKEIGDFGKYSKYIVYLGALTELYGGFLFLISFFTLGIPDHRCAIPGLDNDTYAIQDDLHLGIVNRTIPMKSGDDALLYDQCNYLSEDEMTGKTVLVKCDKWVYDWSIYQSSLAADLNMVCDRSILKSNAQMIFFGGLLTGSFLTGIASDKFGRKPTMCVSSLLYVLAALAITWAPNFGVYVALSFCVGFFAVGNFMPAYVMGMELVGPSSRKTTAFIHQVFWAFGNAILTGIAYFVRDWQKLQIICAAPGILFQLFWIIYPESPRWLFTQNKMDAAKSVLRKAAKWEKVTLSEELLDRVCVRTETPEQKHLGHLFASRTLLKRTLILYFNWVVVCLAYYGLALNSGDFGLDMYLTYFLQTMMELPASFITLVLLDRLGRKPLMAGSMILGGAGCISTVFTMIFAKDSQVLTTVFAMVGKLGACAGFLMVYLYSAELFPTVVRNAGMGSSSCMARVGGMIAPYVADLDRLVSGDIGKALPQIVFGSLSVIAGLLALQLPETLNRSLPETIKDGEMFGREKDAEVKKPEKDIYVYTTIKDVELQTYTDDSENLIQGESVS